MKIGSFHGGLNTRLAPELIAPHEAVEATNVDLTSGQLTSERGLGDANPVIPAYEYPYYWDYGNQYLPNADRRTFQPWQRSLFWTEDTIPTYRGSKILPGGSGPYLLGIDRPSAPAVVLSGGGPLNGDITYVITFYSSFDGTESAPSDPVTITTAGNSVDLTLPPPADPQVTHIRIYRVGGTITEFTMVAQVGLVPVFTDNIADASLPGPALSDLASGNLPPPDDSKYLTRHRHLWFVASGPTLRFTDDRGNPNYWPETNYIEFEDDITGIAPAAEALVVFTRYRSYAIIGNSALSLSRYLISGSQGCISHKTISPLGGATLFVSTDGICTTNGTRVELLSSGRLGIQRLDPVVAITHDEEYLLLLTDHRILIWSQAWEPHFRYYDPQQDTSISFQTPPFWLFRSQDAAYAVIETPINQIESRALFSGNPLPLQYRTGNLTDGSASTEKSYGLIHMLFSGEFKFDIFVDDMPVVSRTITSSGVRTDVVAVPQVVQNGSRIAFRFDGTGAVKEISFNSLPREAQVGR